MGYLVNTKHTKWEVEFRFGQYEADETIAIQAVDARTGELDATVTVCMPEMPQEGCVWIKDYGENEGWEDELLRLGLIELTGRTCSSGFVVVNEGRLIGDWEGK